MDLVEIQAAYYMVAATGVLVAAGYYILNMRETMKSRLATFANNVLQTLTSEDGILRRMETMRMQWSDFEDFKSKYDSSVNPQSYAKRSSLWATCETVGLQYRSGIIDLKTVDDVGGYTILLQWLKFKPIIEKYRDWEWPKYTFSNFEYLAEALAKMIGERNADYMSKLNVIVSTHLKDQ